ncbi:MAG TPA: PEP-CTERM sorting domain-containing protein, partial [Roseiarcus sp.]|nr:PEP-CTERM sorting domain-containing protein [Roseiarcus sp.]
MSGSPLSDTSTYDNATLATLGVTPGVYEWTWGTGPNQNFTVDAVPEPSTWIMALAGFAGLGVAAWGARRARRFQSRDPRCR